MHTQTHTHTHTHKSRELKYEYIMQKHNTVEPPNNGHSGDRPLVHCREVVPISEVMPRMLQSVGGKQCVCSTEVVRFSERTLSEVPL